jgi:ribosomal protein L14
MASLDKEITLHKEISQLLNANTKQKLSTYWASLTLVRKAEISNSVKEGDIYRALKAKHKHRCECPDCNSRIGYYDNAEVQAHNNYISLLHTRAQHLSTIRKSMNKKVGTTNATCQTRLQQQRQNHKTDHYSHYHLVTKEEYLNLIKHHLEIEDSPPEDDDDDDRHNDDDDEENNESSRSDHHRDEKSTNSEKEKKINGSDDDGKKKKKKDKKKKKKEKERCGTDFIFPWICIQEGKIVMLEDDALP